MSEFYPTRSIEILERTPATLHTLLSGVRNEWVEYAENLNTRSPNNVVGEWMQGKCTDSIPRRDRVLSDENNVPFASFDHFAQLTESGGNLPDPFESLRKKNLEIPRSKNIREDQLNHPGIQPDFRLFRLRNLPSASAVYVLGQDQITRAMARLYTKNVNTWGTYLKVLNDSPES